MKKLLCAVMAIVMFLALAVPAAAKDEKKDEIDLSGMSFDELVALKDKINLAIWESEEWQEVTVPQGLYVVGEDIPAGKWTITCQKGRQTYIKWGEKLDDTGLAIDNKGRHDMCMIYNPEDKSFDDSKVSEYTLEIQEGDFVLIDKAASPAVFSPYSGKPTLGFK